VDRVGEIRVLSGGAVEPGLHAFAALAKQEAGHDLVIQFATAPQIAKRLAVGERYDLLIASPATLAETEQQGKP
jgi:molybdate transport system substrate-binding protein